MAQYVRDGKLRALAFTGAARWDGMPEGPDHRRSSAARIRDAHGWQGWFAPANTPGAIIARLYAEIRKALAAPKVRAYLVAGSYEIVGDSPEEFRRFLNAELKRYAEIARAAKIRIE